MRPIPALFPAQLPALVPILLPALLLTLLPALVAAEDSNASGIRVVMQEKGAATFYVAGEIVGYGPVELMVDTGSGYMTINERTLAVLKRRGAAHYVKELQGVLADGSELQVPVYSIARLRIGADCWLEDVEAAVFPGSARQILGLSALRRAAPFVFSVDPPALTLSRCEGFAGMADEVAPEPRLVGTGDRPG